MAFDNSVLFNGPNGCPLVTNTFVPYDQFDLDIVIKVTAASYYRNLADLNCSTNPSKASNQAVLFVLSFASIGSTNMD